ncbi:MAG: hypothetical protein RBU30_08995 [Polyangia bacterium]|jgi:hypothetical protein|nr:hypothetical protein [Polyangia bacterium]
MWSVLEGLQVSRVAPCPRRILCALALFSLATACDSEDEQRESERDTVRGERARKARAYKAREDFRKRWHAEYRQEIARATGKHTPPPLPPKSCEPWDELKQRAQSPHHLSTYAEAVGRLLSPSAASLVELDGRPHQLFRFALRMHPQEEPPLNRLPARDELELDLQWVPLCPEGRVVIHTEVLRLGLTRHPPAGRTGLQLRLPGRKPPSIAPGEPVELLLNPSVSSIFKGSAGHSGSRPPGRPGADGQAPKVGIWQITDARFPDRPRTRRLELDTSAFGDRLHQIAAVEVRCPAPSGLCQFLTRTHEHRERPIELGDLLRQGSPISKEEEAKQLWAVLLALRYSSCSSGEIRTTSRRHPCLDPLGPSASEACQYWLALNGYQTKLVLLRGSAGFEASQVLSCPGQRHRVLRVEATFARGGDLRLRETDLTSRAAELDTEVSRITQ